MNTLGEILAAAMKDTAPDAEFYVRMAYLQGKIDGGREMADSLMAKLTGGKHEQRSCSKS